MCKDILSRDRVVIGMDQNGFLSILNTAFKHSGSDIHLSEGLPVCIRIKGELQNLNFPLLTAQNMLQIVQWVAPNKIMEENKEYDTSFEVKDMCRFRVNIFFHSARIAVVMRLIPHKIPSIEDLGVCPVLKKIAEMPRGLILVTGSTGSGKSSTLAAMVHHLNQHDRLHIITIEDPIEFVHTPKNSRIVQREVGKDTESFSQALIAALRQDPDVILVGEMRDRVTVDIALKASETGHAVFSTVHTTDAMKTVGRIIALFPAEEQRMIRLRLADNLSATISQRLVKKAEGVGLIPAQEIMINNAGIAECISNPEMTAQINEFITKSYGDEGGQTFEQHLIQLYKDKLITLEVAKAASSNPADFERNAMFGS